MNLSIIYRNFGRIYRQHQPSINYRRFDQIYRSASPVHFWESSDNLPTGSQNLPVVNRRTIETHTKPFVNQRLGTASPSRFGRNGGLFHGGRTCGEPQSGFARSSLKGLINGPNGLSQLRPEYASFMPLLTHNRSTWPRESFNNRQKIVKESSSETSESSSGCRSGWQAGASDGQSSHNRFIRRPKSFHRFDATPDLLTESAMTNRPIIVWYLLCNRLIGAAERHADSIYRQFIDGSGESIEGKVT